MPEKAGCRPFPTPASRVKKGTGPICAQHPSGRSGKLDLSPFSRRGMRAKEALGDQRRIDRGHVREARSAANGQSGDTGSTWAALVKRVFEVNPLECAKRGAEMKVIAFIERGQRDVVEKILRHCGLREGPLRTLPTARGPPNTKASDLGIDDLFGGPGTDTLIQ